MLLCVRVPFPISSQFHRCFFVVVGDFGESLRFEMLSLFLLVWDARAGNWLGGKSVSTLFFLVS